MCVCVCVCVLSCWNQTLMIAIVPSTTSMSVVSCQSVTLRALHCQSTWPTQLNVMNHCHLMSAVNCHNCHCLSHAGSTLTSLCLMLMIGWRHSMTGFHSSRKQLDQLPFPRLLFSVRFDVVMCFLLKSYCWFVSYQWGAGLNQPHIMRPLVGSIRPSPERLQRLLGAWTRAGLYYQPHRPWPL